MKNEQVFVIEDGILKKHTGPGGDVIIPEGITEIGSAAFGGCTGLTSVTIPEGITEIGSYAFRGCTGLTSVTIPEGVTGIGSYAFIGCTGLTSVTIPEGVTGIEWGTFKGCTGLTGVTIPASVTEIELGAFEGCTGLTHIYVAAGNRTYCSIDGMLATQDEDGLVLERCPEGKTGELTIPQDITEIGSGAFEGCTGLTSVTIPEGVTEIGWEAFEGCTSLTSVTIPASVTGIYWPFQGCTALTDIQVDAGNQVLRMTDGMLLWQDPDQQARICVLGALPGITGELIVPEGVTDIASYAFRDCTGPFCVTLPASIGNTFWHRFVTGYLSWAAFAGCKGLTGITLPEGITHIEPGAFKDCTNLTRVDLPASVTQIDLGSKGRGTFQGCTSLTEINVDAKNQVYGSCDGMLLKFDEGKSVLLCCPMGKVGALSIPEGVTEISWDAFKGCTGLTSITIPASVTNVSSNFDYCKGLTHIYVAARNRTYRSMDGMLVKQDKDSLVLERCPEGRTGELTIPQGVTEIDWKAFKGCTRLTRVSIPEGVTKIGQRAFYACARMERIDISEGVTIYGETFKRCYHLKDVFLPASVTRIDDGTFSDCGMGKYVSHILTIHAPAGSCAEKYAKDFGHRFESTYQ